MATNQDEVFSCLAFDSGEFLRPRQAALETMLAEVAAPCMVLRMDSVQAEWREQGIEGPVRIVARAQFVGRLLLAEKTWIWSWAEGSHHAEKKTDARAARRFGEDRGIEFLVQPRFMATELLATQLAVVTAKISNGDGIWMSKGDRVAGLWAIHDIRKAR